MKAAPALLLVLLAGCGGGGDDTAQTNGGGAGAAGDGGTSAEASDGPAPEGADEMAPEAGDEDGAASGPSCTTVTGTGAVTFTKDEGATLAPTSKKLAGVQYTHGLVALDVPGTLVAESGGIVLRSTDDGCTWAPIGPAPTSPTKLVAAKGGRAYGFSDNGSEMYRVDGTTITAIVAPTANVLGLGVDREDGDRLRVGGSDATLWESTDGGSTFSPVGTPPASASGLSYRWAFDPADLDHILFGAASTGAAVSKNGGQTWSPSSLPVAGGLNAFEIAISPADGDVVWLQGIDLAETLVDGGVASDGRHIWRSTDGGATFVRVVDQSAEVTIRNQELLAPHPTDTGVLYFVFGTFYGGYGTDVYRYDEKTKAVTRTHNAYDDFGAVAFARGNPSVMYFGITSEQIGP